MSKSFNGGINFTKLCQAFRAKHSAFSKSEKTGEVFIDFTGFINDKIDNNNDGKPDCKFPPTYNKVIPAWKCGTPSLQKVFVCFKTNSGGTITICTPYAAVNTHIAAGNRLGICGSSKCGGL